MCLLLPVRRMSVLVLQKCMKRHRTIFKTQIECILQKMPISWWTDVDQCTISAKQKLARPCECSWKCPHLWNPERRSYWVQRTTNIEYVHLHRAGSPLTRMLASIMITACHLIAHRDIVDVKGGCRLRKREKMKEVVRWKAGAGILQVLLPCACSVTRSLICRGAELLYLRNRSIYSSLYISFYIVDYYRN